MNATKQTSGKASMVLIAIDEASVESCITGEIWNEYTETAIPFGNLAEFIFKVDGLLDTLRFPQSSTEIRGKSNTPMPEATRKNTPKRFSDWVSISKRKHSRLTFVLHILYRQNASWQGYLYKVDRKTNSDNKEYFRSAMEAMYLLSSLCQEHARAKGLQKNIG